MAELNFDKEAYIAPFTVKVDTAKCRGYFEHDEYGDGCGGGLWFDTVPVNRVGSVVKKWELADYDGVACLPMRVIKALRGMGFIVGEEFE